MSEETVRVVRTWDPMTFDTIRRGQVPAGYVRIHLQGYGEFFADPSEKPAFESKIRHGPFPEVAREALRRFQLVFQSFYTRTLEQWEDGFRRDMTPWREMAIWDVWAGAVERFTAHLTGDDELTRGKRTDIVRVVLTLGNSPPPAENVRFLPVGTVSATRVKEINGYLSGPGLLSLQAAIEKYRRLLRPIVLTTPFPDEVLIHALFDERGEYNLSAPFDAQEFLGAADLVFAQDVGTGERVLVYGRDLADRIAAREDTGTYRAATVVLDAGSGEFELLCAAIEQLKGHQEYRPES